MNTMRNGQGMMTMKHDGLPYEEMGYCPPPNRKLPPVPGVHSNYNTIDRIKDGKKICFSSINFFGISALRKWVNEQTRNECSINLWTLNTKPVAVRVWTVLYVYEIVCTMLSQLKLLLQRLLMNGWVIWESGNNLFAVLHLFGSHFKCYMIF